MRSRPRRSVESQPGEVRSFGGCEWALAIAVDEIDGSTSRVTRYFAPSSWTDGDLGRCKWTNGDRGQRVFPPSNPGK